MKSNKFLKKLIVAMLSVTLLVPATSFLDNSNNYAQAVKNGWVKVKVGKFGYDWYYYENGVPLKNQWKHYFYYLKSDGKMANNEWIYDNNKKAWYLIGQDGRFYSGSWVEWYKDREYYFLHTNGKMAHDEWIDYYYYLKSDGKMAAEEWIYDKGNSAWYYLDYHGKFLSSVWKGEYYLKSNGKMAHDQWIDYLYYVKSDGKMARDEWIFDKNYNAWYYLKSDGKYARNEWIGNYWVGPDGKYVK